MPVDEVASGRVCACSLHSRLIYQESGLILTRMPAKEPYRCRTQYRVSTRRSLIPARYQVHRQALNIQERVNKQIGKVAFKDLVDKQQGREKEIFIRYGRLQMADKLLP